MDFNISSLDIRTRILYPPPPLFWKTVLQGLHLTCKSGGDADFYLVAPPPPPLVFAHYATVSSSLVFRPPGHEKNSPPL